MLPPPPISEFVLHPQSQPPHVPSLIRSRNQPPAHTHHPSIFSQQVIIDVHPSQHHREINARDSNSSIRKQVDICLDAIEEAFKGESTRRTPHTTSRKNTKDFGNIDTQSIHRVDNKLLLEYLATLSGQYPIRNRFAKNYINSTQSHYHPRVDPQSIPRAVSVGTTNNKKTFLNLTQASKMPRRSLSGTKPNRSIYTESPLAQRSINKISQISYPQPHYPQQRGPRAIQKDFASFSYCINCQKPVPSKDIDHHQQKQCSNFHQLYKMTFKQLFEVVEVKMKKMVQELMERIAWLRQNQDKHERFVKIISKTIDQIEQYLSRGPLDYSRSQQNFAFFQQSLDNFYHTTLELTHKVHWFGQVREQLKRQIQKKNEEIPAHRGQFRKTMVPTSPMAWLQHPCPLPPTPNT